MARIIPIKDFVLLKPIAENSAIVIPESVDPTKQGKQFEVTAVGRECKYIKKGDKVITTVAGALGSFENEGKLYYITKEAAVCAMVRG